MELFESYKKGENTKIITFKFIYLFIWKVQEMLWKEL